jgi:ATP-dependent exoDNAse (exonuclease V) alpha subunit
MLVTSTATLAASAAGDAYNALCAEHPDRVVTLTTNQRQLTEQGRAIADALHQRDVDTAWQRIKDGESVIVTRSREDKLRVLAATVADCIGEHGASEVTCDAVTNAEVDELNTRIHDRLIDLGRIDPAGVVAYQSGSRERRLGVGTVLRVDRPTGAHAKDGTRLVRGELATVTHAGRERVSVEFDDGRTRSISPRTLLAHFDYGYAGTTHKVQGRTSAVRIASLGPGKDIASMYVSASRAREKTVFVVDARDYLTDGELVAMQTWERAHIDDEVLDRVHTALTRRTDRIDSPRAHLRPAPQPAPYVPPSSQGRSSGYGGMSM